MTTPHLSTKPARKHPGVIDKAFERLRAAGVMITDSPSTETRLALMFPGHGSQSPTMFDSYLTLSPAASEVVAMADRVVTERYGHSLTDAVAGRTPREFRQPTVMQPAIYTASVAGAAMAREHGIVPDLVFGHSLGEYAAMVAAGVTDAETGLHMVLDRAECVESIPADKRGDMLAVLLSDPLEHGLVRREVIARAATQPVAVGVINGDRQVVVSGDSAALADIAVSLADEGIRSSLLPIGVGFHSRCLSPTVQRFQARLTRYTWCAPTTPLISSVFGGEVDDASIELLPQLLAQQLVTPFDFRTCVRLAAARGIDTFLDCGPKAVLRKLVGGIVGEGSANIAQLDFGPKDPTRSLHSLDALGWLTSGTLPDPGSASAGEPAAPSVSVAGTADVVEDLVAPVVVPGVAEVEAKLLGALVECTGYPAELVERDLDLEADLGVDSVKRVEIVGLVASDLQVDARELDFSGALTLADLARVMAGALAPVAVASEPADVSNEPVEESFGGIRRYIPQSVAQPQTGPLRSLDTATGCALVVSSGDPSTDRSIVTAMARFHAAVRLTRGGEPAELARTLEELRAHGRLTTVVDLTALLGESADPTAEGDQWWDQVSRQYETTFVLNQAVYEDLRAAGEHASYLAVTRVGGLSGIDLRAEGNSAGAVVTGFMKTIAQELPEMTVKLIDLDTLEGNQLATTVADEFTHASVDGDIEIGYLAGQRHVVRILPEPVAASRRAVRQPFPAGGTVVMSGGSRGIVRECAIGLALDQPVNVVLLGRSDPDDPDVAEWLELTDEQWRGAQAQVMRWSKQRHPSWSVTDLKAEYERIGHIRLLIVNLRDAQSRCPRIHYMTCDVADPIQVEQTMRRVRAEIGPICGVVHGAGLESFGRLPGKQLARTMRAIEVKARGFQNLLRSTVSDELLSFCSFGSISGRFGMDGQADYTAGAALLSALSHTVTASRALNPRRLPFVTMEWSAWDGVGMAMHPEVIRVQAGTRGMTYIPTWAGVRLFVDELELGTANPEVLYFGEIGANRPKGQFAALDDDLTMRRAARAERRIIDERPVFPMIDTVTRGDESHVTACRTLSFTRDKYLPDHRVKGLTTFPGVMHLETQLETAGLFVGNRSFGVEVEKLTLSTFLKCRDNDKVDIAVHARKVAPDVIETELTSVFRLPSGAVLDPNRKQSSARVRLLPELPTPTARPWDVATLFDGGIGEIDVDRYYGKTGDFISFGETFRYLRRARLMSERLIVGELFVNAVPGLFSDVANPHFLSNPILIDNVGRLALMRQMQYHGQHIVPTEITGARQYRQPQVRETVYGRIEVLEDFTDGICVHLEIADANGVLICEADRVRLTAVGSYAGDTNVLINETTK